MQEIRNVIIQGAGALGAYFVSAFMDADEFLHRRRRSRRALRTPQTRRAGHQRHTLRRARRSSRRRCTCRPDHRRAQAPPSG